MPCLEHFIERCPLCPATGANAPEYQAPVAPTRSPAKPYKFDFGAGVQEGPVQPNPVEEGSTYGNISPETLQAAREMTANIVESFQPVCDALAKSVLEQADRFATAREDLAKVESEIVTLKAKLKIAEGRRRQAKHDLKVSRKEMTAALKPQKEDKSD